MRKIVICLIALMSIGISLPADAGLFDNEVELEDLFQLSPEVLNTLKDVEFAVFIAKVKLSGAKVNENRAKEDLKRAKSQVETKRLELKAAKAKYNEESETSAGKRALEAQAALKRTQEQHDVVQLLVKWKKKELDVQSAGVDKEKVAVSVAEADRELARVLKLFESKVSSSSRYDIDDFKKSLEKRRKEYEKAMSREKKEMIDAATLKEKYEKAAKR